jgi:hypothetical protein
MTCHHPHHASIVDTVGLTSPEKAPTELSCTHCNEHLFADKLPVVVAYKVLHMA